MKKFITALAFIIALASCSNNMADKTASKETDTTAPFTIDLSHSKFKYNSCTRKTFFYTLNGFGEADYLHENSFYVMVIDIKDNFEKRKAYAKVVVEKYKIKGFTISAVEEKEINIAHDRAYEICFMGEYRSQLVKFYVMVTGNHAGDLLFCGTAINDYDAMTQEFRNAAQTLRTR